MAGLVNAVVSVPDGLAAAALAGVNPVAGLYTSIAAPVAGSVLASAQLMQIATTSAAALAAGQAVAAYPDAERQPAMVLLGVLTGAFLVVLGLLRAGRLARYVSHAVMTGFLIGVSAVLVLDQLAPLVGYAPERAGLVVRSVELVRNVPLWDVRTLVVGAVALVAMVLLARTRLETASSLLVLVVLTGAVALLGWGSVSRVEDVSPIPSGLPPLVLPDPGLLTVDLVLAAFALAVVVAIQGAGVSQSVENRDGSPVSTSRDMVAQGAGNLAAGALSGIPAGGSVGQTALNVQVGARGRWSGIFAGLWMLLIVLVLPTVVGLVPMSVLAAIMIVAGAGAIDLREALSIWRTGGAARLSIVATFVATLVTSIPVAVAIGVGLTVILFLASSASDVSVRRLRRDDGRLTESDPPARLADEEVVVLSVYGSLFFAGDRTLAERLPDPDGAHRPVVVLRLRGRTRVGATLIDVLDRYADRLHARGGRLYLAGLHPDVREQLERSRKLDLVDAVRLYDATDRIGGSADRARSDARAWLARADRVGAADADGTEPDDEQERRPRSPVPASRLGRSRP